MSESKRRLLPFSLTGAIVLADQITKFLIVKKFPPDGSAVFPVFGNDFLWITHVRNRAIAFSLGRNLPAAVQHALFIAVPILLLIFLLWLFFKSGDLNGFQRWVICGITGGGLGNLIDRIFRPLGVVDFVSVKFYGFLGMERWPTFNVADSAVVVCGLLLAVSFFTETKK